MTWKYVVWRAASLLFIIVLISYFAGDGWKSIPSALVAWGTILLAYVTFLSVKKSTEQGEQFRAENERIRREDSEHEFKAKALDRIERWIKEALETKSEYLRVPRFEVVDMELLRRVLIKRDVLVSQREYITIQTKLFDFDQKSAEALKVVFEIRAREKL